MLSTQNILYQKKRKEEKQTKKTISRHWFNPLSSAENTWTMLKKFEILILTEFAYLAQYHQQNLSHGLLQPQGQILTQTLTQAIIADVVKSFLKSLTAFDNFSCSYKASPCCISPAETHLNAAVLLSPFFDIPPAEHGINLLKAKFHQSHQAATDLPLAGI